jgi:ferritin-like metal-binding protein YciE|tara:strand:- start:9771 stop:10238 length:468 start_codon:yes stop_codon:yes gene_type:complete
MSRTKTEAELLRVCLQDLYAGCCALYDRAPTVTDHARGEALRRALHTFIQNCEVRAQRLIDVEDVRGGPENLWMAGILDDAERDTESHTHGNLLDIALVGAIRKALAAEIVSVETAFGLANRLRRAAIADTLSKNISDLMHSDEELKIVLSALTA